MGASDFSQIEQGRSAQEAFNEAVHRALYDHGHAGYSGTMAEKHEFVMIDVPEGEDPEAYAEKMMREDDERINNKWGPAGCVKLEGDQYLFFGWASS